MFASETEGYEFYKKVKNRGKYLKCECTATWCCDADSDSVGTTAAAKVAEKHNPQASPAGKEKKKRKGLLGRIDKAFISKPVRREISMQADRLPFLGFARLHRKKTRSSMSLIWDMTVRKASHPSAWIRVGRHCSINLVIRVSGELP